MEPDSCQKIVRKLTEFPKKIFWICRNLILFVEYLLGSKFLVRNS